MPRGETQLDADLGVDTVEDEGEDADDEGGRAVRDRLRAGAGRVASGRALVLAFVATAIGAIFLGGAIPLGGLSTLLGVFLAAFVYGTFAGANRYLEHGLAGTVVGGATTLLGNLTLTTLGPGVPILAVGAIAGGVAGLLGHYFGRDLRDGLTRDL